MEHIIPKKLICWNINIASGYLEFLNVLSWKTWKTIGKISNILLGIRYSRNINSIISGIILPKQLQIQFLKFCPKDWLFLKISTKLQIELTISWSDAPKKIWCMFWHSQFMQIFVGIFYCREALMSKENLFFDKPRVLASTF